jgi:hypothetical protein
MAEKLAMMLIFQKHLLEKLITMITDGLNMLMLMYSILVQK